MTALWIARYSLLTFVVVYGGALAFGVTGLIDPSLGSLIALLSGIGIGLSALFCALVQMTIKIRRWL